MKVLLLFMVITLLNACASQRPKNASNYETDLVFPKEVYPFKFVDKNVFQDPLSGVMLRYVDIKNPTDYITAYIYPIPNLSWDDRDQTLSAEMKHVLAEVDYIVDLGQYQSRDKEANTKFVFTSESKQYDGLKSTFTFVDKSGANFDSFAYLFISQDKFVKFRISFNSEETPNWSGDEIVKTLMPEIVVPNESNFMKDLRKQHEEKISNQLLNFLLQAVDNEHSESKNTEEQILSE